MKESDGEEDLGLHIASKPIYLTISTETLPVTVDALSSSSSSGIISPTSLSSKTAAVRGGPVNSVDDDDDDDDKQQQWSIHGSSAAQDRAT